MVLGNFEKPVEFVDTSGFYSVLYKLGYPVFRILEARKEGDSTYLKFDVLDGVVLKECEVVIGDTIDDDVVLRAIKSGKEKMLEKVSSSNVEVPREKELHVIRVSRILLPEDAKVGDLVEVDGYIYQIVSLSENALSKQIPYGSYATLRRYDGEAREPVLRMVEW